MACFSVTADDISCTVNITIYRDDNYTVSLTLSNDVGSTQPVESMFNCELPIRVLSISSLRNRISIVISAVYIEVSFSPATPCSQCLSHVIVAAALFVEYSVFCYQVRK